MPWQWDSAANRYRSSQTGRYLSQQQVVGLRDRYADVLNERSRVLSQRLTGGEISLSEWVRQARADIKTAYLDQYMLGRGGRNAMTKADYGRVGQMVKRQYQFLQSFAQDVADGTLSEAQIQARLRLYMEGSTAAFERGYSQGALGMPQLPAYPGDGSSICKTMCRCGWLIESVAGGWECTWVLGTADHCETCVERAGKWNPLKVEA